MRRSHERPMRERTGKRAFLLSILLAAALSVLACGSGAGKETASAPETEAVTEAAAGSVSEAEVLRETEELRETEQIKETEPPEPSAEGAPAPLTEELADGLGAEFLEDIPEYSGEPYTAVNDNVPFFDRTNLPTESFEYYSDLDELGRCRTACVNIGTDIMPVKEREGIGQVRPSGWHTVKYENVDGNYLYNRCHLIGYQLSAENANEKNLITGTRYLNVSGMLPFENMVADYVKETENHVLYRVTPVFENDDLVARGVLMEGWSVEDDGDGICFNVFAYNVQPDIVIDYASGESRQGEPVPIAKASVLPEGQAEVPAKAPEEDASEETAAPVLEETAEEPEPEPVGTDYILNTNTHKFHYPTCASVKQMAEKNKQFYSGTRDEVIDMGYVPCKKCNP